VVDLRPDEQAALESNRAWQIAAAQGTVDSPTALAYVRSLHDTYKKWASRDPEMVKALDIGDQHHWDEDHRWYPPDHREPPPDYDPETTRVFDQLVAAHHIDNATFVDWPEFWATEQPEEDWLIDGVIARGRGHAIYAQQKQGKSLYTLWAMAHLATTLTDVDVIYLDYEMTPADVRERLEDMGYGPDSDLSRLHYAFAPDIAPLDTAEGAGQLVDLLDSIPGDRQLVVCIDTTGRAVEGEENSNDTIRNFYRCTGVILKRWGVTWVRVDHAGKDSTKGQRGGSAKGDDVDIVWHLTATDVGIKLHRDAARMSWVPETVAYARNTDPLFYLPTNLVAPEGTSALADILDKLDVPLEASTRVAQDALKAAGEGKRRTLVVAAMKWRRTCAITPGTVPEPPSFPEAPEPLPEPEQETPADQREPLTGTTGTTTPATGGSRFPPPRAEPEPGPTCRCGQPATDISGLCPGCIANPGNSNNTLDF